jgi:anthranilate synthase component I
MDASAHLDIPGVAPRTGAATLVHRALPADIETPISVFLKLRSGGTAFLLESAEHDGRLGRYSFIGIEPRALLRAGLEGGVVETDDGATSYRGDVLDALRDLVASGRIDGAPADIPPFAGGAVGALSFDFVRGLERLPGTPAEDSASPVALFARFDTVVIFDHLAQRLIVTSLAVEGDDRDAARARVERVVASIRTPQVLPALDADLDTADPDALLHTAERVPSDDAFLNGVARAREYIHAGDAIQVVLSRRLSVPFAGDPFRVYRLLRMINPSPYMFFLEFPDVTLIGASPEMLLRVAGDAAQLCPIAGTSPRGADTAEDAALERELLADPKERAEHLMLVDLARNDLGRVCRPGSVQVPRFMQVERFSHVMHLASSVTGRLGGGVDPLHALAASFPAGTVSGAPKVRALEIIDELEPVRRGFYAGAVGYLGAGCETLDTCIAIRTIVVKDGQAHVQAGAGVVADSVPERELRETGAKARAMLAALAAAEQAHPLPEAPELGDTSRTPPAPAGATPRTRTDSEVRA